MIIITCKTVVVGIGNYQSVRNVIPWGCGFRCGRWNWGSKWYSLNPTVEMINWGSLRNIWNWFRGLSSSSWLAYCFLLSHWRWARWGGSWSFHTGWWTFWRSYHRLWNKSIWGLHWLVLGDFPYCASSQKLLLLLNECGSKRNHGTLEVFFNYLGSSTHLFSGLISLLLHSLHMNPLPCLDFKFVWVFLLCFK